MDSLKNISVGRVISVGITRTYIHHVNILLTLLLLVGPVAQSV